MPEFTKSSVGSFAGTSELEDTTVCPFERKYSRKLERISFDFIAIILLQGKNSRGGSEAPGWCSGVDAAVLE
jgi:hypothetical protein